MPDELSIIRNKWTTFKALIHVEYLGSSLTLKITLLSEPNKEITHVLYLYRDESTVCSPCTHSHVTAESADYVEIIYFFVKLGAAQLFVSGLYFLDHRQRRSQNRDPPSVDERRETDRYSEVMTWTERQTGSRQTDTAS